MLAINSLSLCLHLQDVDLSKRSYKCSSEFPTSKQGEKIISIYVCVKTVFEVQPSLSSEIGPLDLYRWGRLKSLIYSYPIENEKPIHQRMLDAC